MATRFARTTRSLAHDGGHRTLFAWLTAAVLLTAWFVWFVFGRVTLYEVSRHARLEVQQSAHPVAALVPSKITVNTLVLGQEVHAGDRLIELDAAPEKLRLAEEATHLRAIVPRIASLKKEIASLEQAAGRDRAAAVAANEAAQFRTREAVAAVEFARDNEHRLREESAVGGVAQIEAARAHTEALKLGASQEALAAESRRLATEAQARAYQQEAQVESLRRSVLSLEGEVAASEATSERLKQEIDRHTVRAPIDGTVADVAALHTGAYVAQGERLATVVPHGSLIIVADFAPAAVLGRIRPGQSARLRLDGFPWAQYGSIEATVTRVAGEVHDGLVRVEFAPAVSAPSRLALQHGLPGTIEVGIEQVTPAQLVLRAAGRFDASAPAAPQPASGPGEVAAK
ncbi:HlyD family efflux transporter periplasmic adaptor subunit [Ramlibacter sp.]|uniref:HlyD family secretion protein n=1 Tax=Ramlibacter sp. TaxID=1917967 RepID=UPI002604FAEE|nr:HlyD family efflux transporter periplasmic adaptor subunit [Ramlibacter sp.]MDB5955427.1 putative secretion protein [Ramlibacter sp.]